VKHFHHQFFGITNKKTIMKNYKIYLIMILSALAFTSCMDDDAAVFNNAAYVVDYPNVTNAQEFRITPLIDVSQASVVIDVPIRLVSNLGTPISQDITGTYEIDVAQSTAVEGVNFEILDNSSFTIPAGQGESTFSVSVLGESIDPDATPLVLVLKLTSAQANATNVLASGKTKNNTVYIEFSPICPISESLAGSHDVVFTSVCIGNGGGPAACDDAPGAIGLAGYTTWTEDPDNPGTIFIGEASFGYYALLGIPDEGQGPNVHFLTWACRTLIFDAGIQDSYSDPFTYDIVGVVGPVMTIHFTNTWGDDITFELTREGGIDWPALLQS